MEKFTYWDNPLNRSNISHKGEVCDQFFKSLIVLSGTIHWRSRYSVTDKPHGHQSPHRWRQVQVHRRVQETAPSAPKAFCAWLLCIRGQKGIPRGVTLEYLTLYILPVIFSKSNTTLFSGKDSACQCWRCRRHGFNSWEWQPTPVLLPGKSHGLKSLASYSSWGPNKSDMTERLSTQTGRQ